MKSIGRNKILEIANLRKKGYGYPEISNMLAVSKTTAQRYAKNIKILPEYLDNWIMKRGGSRLKKIQTSQKARKQAMVVVGELSEKEKLLILTSLYWAEGSKNDFGISNTDPFLIKIFMSGLRELFGVKNEEIRVSIRIYEDINRDEALDFWSKIVNIPKEDFCSVNVLKGKKNGKLKYGMCRIRKGGDLLKLVKAINSIVSERMSP